MKTLRDMYRDTFCKILDIYSKKLAPYGVILTLSHDDHAIDRLFDRKVDAVEFLNELVKVINDNQCMILYLAHSGTYKFAMKCSTHSAMFSIHSLPSRGGYKIVLSSIFHNSFEIRDRIVLC